MSRILEFIPSQDEAVVARVLVLVHQAVDENFPSAGPANRQFTKTVFSEGEQTSIVRLPSEPEGTAASGGQFGSSEDTSPIGRPAPETKPHQVPPPPRAGLRGATATPHATPPPPAVRHKPPTGEEERPPKTKPPQSLSGQAITASTRLDSTINQLRVKPPLDRQLIFLAAALFVGCVLLAYLLIF